MLSEDGRHLNVGWDEYHRLIERLARLVHASGWRFDHVLGLSRGGLRPGDVLSRIFERPLAVLATSSYREAAGMLQGPLVVGDRIASAGGSIAGRVLVVDDLVDSGRTLQAVEARLKRMPEVVEARSAVLWSKACTAYRPDYVVERLTTSPWIHQPFEIYDERRPEALAVADDE